MRGPLLHHEPGSDCVPACIGPRTSVLYNGQRPPTAISKQVVASIAYILPRGLVGGSVRVPSRLEEFAPRQCKSRVEKRRRPTFAGNLTGRARWVAVPLSRDAFD